ncbi:MAG: NADH:flavin oxidoreductase [Dehalobacterium sp.]
MKILEPVSFKNLALKNRIVWLPAVTWLADDDGFVTDDLIERHRLRAEGGVGLIIVEATGVLDRKSPKLLRINDDKYIPGLEKMVQAVHDAGAKMSVQLIHFVKQSPRTGWKQDVKDLSYEDIAQIKDDFVQAGIRAKKAGFDAIELHVAHGYTLSSFVSLLNKRTDEYGRNTAGRTKIVADIIEMCRKELGEDYCIGARISGEEFVIGGNTLKQTKEISRIMAEKGLNYLSVSAGGKTEDGHWYRGYSGNRCMPTANYPYCCNAFLAEGIREELAPLGVPVIASGKIHTLENGEKLLNQGAADLIGICRPLLADPEWIGKQAEHREKELVECIYCNTCMERDQKWEPVNCVVAEKKQKSKNK